MQKSIRSFITFTLSFVFAISSLFFSGCNKREFVEINQDKYLFGVDNVTYDMQPAQIDSGVTNSWSADIIGALGAKCSRIFLYITHYVKRNKNDDGVYIDKKAIQVVHDYIDKLKSAGVERILISNMQSFVMPYGYNSNDACAVPSPYDDYEMYCRFLKIQQNVFALLAEEFPEVNYWEAGNEPNLSTGSGFHKKGYDYSKSKNANLQYLFSDEESSYIAMDISWYANKGVKSVNPNNVLIMPALVDDQTTADYLDLIYKHIKSGYLPTAETYSDKNTDNYFQMLCWHPYPELKNNLDVTDFINREKAIYKVVEKHGDGGKPVIYSEIGFSERRFGGSVDGKDNDVVQDTIAKFFVKIMQAIRDELSFVETAYAFRLSNVYERMPLGSDTQENTFGLYYSPNDVVEYASKPKPVALALFEYFNGKDADKTPLYKYYQGTI